MSPLCVIVRHGNTFAAGEIPRRIGSTTDLPLVESGRLQAQRLGEYFMARAWRFDRVLASPLLRTRETAALILFNQDDPPEIQICPWLAEIDHGPDENHTEPEVIARIGADALSAWDAHGIAPQGWHVAAEERQVAWRAFFAARPRGRSLLITSNGAARFALLADDTLRFQAERLPSLKLRTGAFGVIAIDDDGPRVTSWDSRP